MSESGIRIDAQYRDLIATAAREAVPAYVTFELDRLTELYYLKLIAGRWCVFKKSDVQGNDPPQGTLNEFIGEYAAHLKEKYGQNLERIDVARRESRSLARLAAIPQWLQRQIATDVEKVIDNGGNTNDGPPGSRRPDDGKGGHPVGPGLPKAA